MFSGTNLFHKNLYNQKNLKNLFYKRNDVNCFRLDKCDINKSVPAVIIDTFALASTAREAHFFLGSLKLSVHTAYVHHVQIMDGYQ